MLQIIWTKHRVASILSLIFFSLGLVITPWALAIVLITLFGGPLIGKMNFLKGSLFSKWKKEKWVFCSLIIGVILLSLNVDSGGAGYLIFAVIPLIWILIRDRSILKLSNPKTNSKKSHSDEKESFNKKEYKETELTIERESLLKQIKTDGLLLKNASESLKADREIVLTAVESDGAALEFAAKSLKADREIVLKAIKKDEALSIYIDESLQTELVSEGLIKKRYPYPEDGVNQDFYPNSDVWDRGYYEETEDGTWYNVFVNETIKGYYPTCNALIDTFSEQETKFYELELSMYEEYGQINFFVPNGESKLTLDEMTDILI